VVHLELHTRDREGARALFAELCGWAHETIDVRDRSYLGLELGRGLGGGIVECATRRPTWLPYVEVADVAEATTRARRCGAAVLLDPREGPAGWRSVVVTAAAGELAFWQPKR
jgi:predicted enzyme related to lactoylglutathione lyase